MPVKSSPTPVILLRWLARALGLMVAGMAGLFFTAHLGEFVSGDIPPPAAWFSMVLLLTITGGYLAAWKYEATGSMIAIAGAVLLFVRASDNFALYTGIATFPALMHLVCRFWPHLSETTRPTLTPRTKRIVMSAGIAVPLMFAGLFVLEIFTHHGTPYTAETLPETLAGTWSGTGVVYVDPETKERTTAEVTITVHADGSATGMVNDTPIIDAQAQKNRSWFHRKIRFYTDYIFEGTLGGDILPGDGLAGSFLRIPCNITDGTLKGTIFQITRWSYDPIVNRLALTREGPLQGGVEDVDAQ